MTKTARERWIECLFLDEHASGILPLHTSGRGIGNIVSVEASGNSGLRKVLKDFTTNAEKEVLVFRTSDTSNAHHLGYDNSRSGLTEGVCMFLPSGFASGKGDAGRQVVGMRCLSNSTSWCPASGAGSCMQACDDTGVKPIAPLTFPLLLEGRPASLEISAFSWGLGHLPSDEDLPHSLQLVAPWTSLPSSLFGATRPPSRN